MAYKVYYIVLCYIPEDTGGIKGVPYLSMLHPRGYWWYIMCTISFFVTSPRILVVFKVYYIVPCYIPEDTGDI